MQYRVKYSRRCIGALGVFSPATIIIDGENRIDVFSQLWEIEDKRGYEIINVDIKS